MTEPINPNSPSRSSGFIQQGERWAQSPPPQPVSQPPPNSVRQKTFFEQLKDFFKPILPILSTLFGISNIDDSLYQEFNNKLNQSTQNIQKHEDNIRQRAEFLFSESKKVIDHAEKQIEQGKKPWDGLQEDLGVPMSAKLLSLIDNVSEQRYYHNCAFNWWAGVLGGIYPSGGSDQTSVKEIISINDLDNTRINKNLYSANTNICQSLEKSFWAHYIYLLADVLGVIQWINTARSLFGTVIQLVPEGLEKTITRGILPDALLETFGPSLDKRRKGASNIKIVALNSSIENDNGISLSSELIKAAKLYEFLDSLEGPVIDGKTFREALLTLVNEKCFSVFEPKGIPRGIYETSLTKATAILDDYLLIIELKKEIVDKKLKGISEDKKQEVEGKAWREFGEAVLKNLESGREIEQEINALEERLKFERDLSLQEQLEAKKAQMYNYINSLIGDDKKSKLPLSITNFYELLKRDPRAFYEKYTEGVLIAPTFHHYNNHGIPVENSGELVLELLEKYANHSEVREYISRLHMEPHLSKKPPKDIQEFRNKGIRIYLKEGIKAYLEWRMIKFLELRYKREKAKEAKTSNGELLFNCDDERHLKFSSGFTQMAEKAYGEGGLEGYFKFLEETFSNSLGPEMNIPKIVRTFLPNEIALEATKVDLEKESCFYPSEMFSVNNTVAYNGNYLYGSIINMVLKRDARNPDGQYYIELQAASEKHLSLPSFKDVISKKLKIHVAGDSKADICMVASALERGGLADVVFNLIRPIDVFGEIIKQRKDYLKDESFDNNFYQTCRDQLGICALESMKDGHYKKVETLDEKGKPSTFEKDENGKEKLYTEDELIEELSKKYEGRLIYNASPEAFIRRQAEVFSSLSGENIEFSRKELSQAKEAYELKQNGVELTPEQQFLLRRYEWAVILEKEGNFIPEDAPRFNLYKEWRGRDQEGEFIVYRSKKANTELVKDRLDGKETEEFTGGEETLRNLSCVEIFRNKDGEYVYLDRDEGKEVTYTNTGRLDDYVIENKFLACQSPVEGLFANRFLLNVFGKEGLRNLVCNLPNMFNALLKYSGCAMALGGVLRIVSAVGGGFGELIYKAGYWLSNGLRAVSAFGGALRGELNVHKYHNVAFGEIINIISSFLPNGPKHLGLGLGNFVLFLGRGQQRAQIQQRINNHVRPVLENKNAKLSDFVDPRIFARRVTKIGTNLIIKVKEEVKERGLQPLIGELAGNLASAISTPIRMLGDVLEDKRLLFQWMERMSEKSGSFYKSIPSAGHLLTLVGLLSGLGAFVAGIFGRTEKLGELKENGFNKLGKLSIAFANAIPALGIIANAKEVMANPGGLPRMYRDLNGKEVRYDPKKAGLNQFLAGIGYAIIPWFGLDNKYVASLFDIFTGQYFLGAAEEEKPNTYILSLNKLMSSQLLFKD